MTMTGASLFWYDMLHDCNLDRPIPLPYDRYRLSDEHRTGHGTAFSFDFSQDLSHDFLAYALSNNMKPEHLAHAIYYLFLFKLTSGERDLCIGVNTDGRYKEELMSVIGMFVNAIPLRCQLDPNWSLDELIKYVYEIVTSSMKYSYYPLQHILNQHPDVSKPTFLDTSFFFDSTKTKNIDDQIIIGNTGLYAKPISVKISEDEIMSKFDFALIIQHDLNTNQLSCTIEASLDLFDAPTNAKIVQRFHSMLSQLFSSCYDHMKTPIFELSLILPDERLLIQSPNNTQVSFPTVTCIHQKYVHQAMKHPQKVAVELDEQFLTYCELQHYVQLLSLNLWNKQSIVASELVCQCVERSLSMVCWLIEKVFILIKILIFPR
jgi:non-ribosomal peptide synthetase component F